MKRLANIKMDRPPEVYFRMVAVSKFNGTSSFSCKHNPAPIVSTQTAV
jgi:hypothetical protein